MRMLTLMIEGCFYRTRGQRRRWIGFFCLLVCGQLCVEASTNLSHRLIVELDTPPLVDASVIRAQRLSNPGPLRTNTRIAQRYIDEIKSEQARVLSNIERRVSGLQPSQRATRSGALLDNSYQVVINAFVVEPEDGVFVPDLIRAIQQVSGVKKVHRDRMYEPMLFASRPQMNVFSAWSNSVIGSVTNAGRGIKCASIDGGVYHDSPMFSGDGFSYPADYPDGGYGQTNNNNGKIIVSRAYFRSWDPPVDSSTNAWPGPLGISHGVHTAGIMCGDSVDAEYSGLNVSLSGVAPEAWVMSYKVFYKSVNDLAGVYEAELLAAIEDVVKDGADVVNNSWGATGLVCDDDIVQTALENCSKAGVIVVAAAGNDGPDSGRCTHPSPEIITVASLTKNQVIYSGYVRLVGTNSVPSNSLFSVNADFGPCLSPGSVLTNIYMAAELIDPTNAEGGAAWPTGTFDGKIALIRRGGCDFSVKAYNAQQAGAEAVVVYNHEAGGDDLMAMGPGENTELVAIPSVFIGNSDGNALLEWARDHDSPQLEIAATPKMGSMVPNVIAGTSSRGPGVPYVLKPDIAAPGVNVLSQGYTANATGMDVYKGYGQGSGTSMATPQVAGASALLLQIHPDWSPAYIKSALMTSSSYLDVYVDNNNTPAQPLDMGAGAVDLLHAADPGLILDPPSLSFGLVMTGATQSVTLQLTSVADQSETYELSTLCTTGGYDQVSALNGLTLSPSSVTLVPGASATVTATWDSSELSPGDQQGFVVFSGTVHQAHAPAWMITAEPPSADILLIDADFSSVDSGDPDVPCDFADYQKYYTDALDDLQLSYDVFDAERATYPTPAELAGYKMVITFTGDSYWSMSGQSYLREYINAGGKFLAMGNFISYQVTDLFSVSILGVTVLTNSITGGEQPSGDVTAADLAPSAFASLRLKLTNDVDGAGNQYYIPELSTEMAVAMPDIPGALPAYTPLFSYLGGTETADGTISMGHRDQPTLEYPARSFLGRTVYTGFGLEGINNAGGDYSSRSNTLQQLINYLNDEPAGTLAAVDSSSSNRVALVATMSSPVAGATPVTYRWDFGDGSAILTNQTAKTSYSYPGSGIYTCRVETVDNWDNHTVASMTLKTISGGLSQPHILCAAAGEHGTITPEGDITVDEGTSAAFTVAAEDHYRIDAISTNGSMLNVSFDNTSDSYDFTWSHIQADGSLNATFAPVVTTNNPARVPENWLIRYYPNTNDYNAAAISDTDADNMDAWEEYVAGTDPTDSSSFLKLLIDPSSVAGGEGPVFRWIGAPHRTYRIGWTDDLRSLFTLLPVDIPSDYPAMNVYTNPVQFENDGLYYRLQVADE